MDLYIDTVDEVDLSQKSSVHPPSTLSCCEAGDEEELNPGFFQAKMDRGFSEGIWFFPKFNFSADKILLYSEEGYDYYKTV